MGQSGLRTSFANSETHPKYRKTCQKQGSDRIFDRSHQPNSFLTEWELFLLLHVSTIQSEYFGWMADRRKVRFGRDGRNGRNGRNIRTRQCRRAFENSGHVAEDRNSLLQISVVSKKFNFDATETKSDAAPTYSSFQRWKLFRKMSYLTPACDKQPFYWLGSRVTWP